MTLTLNADPLGLSLRSLSAKDADEYFRLLQRNSTHLGADYHGETAVTVAEHAARFVLNPSPPLMFGIRRNGTLIGRIDLVAVNPPKYGMGYWLDSGQTGFGFATTAVKALTQYAQRKLRATDVFAGVTHGNRKSVAVLERCGFDVAVQFDDYDRYHLALRE